MKEETKQVIKFADMRSANKKTLIDARPHLFVETELRESIRDLLEQLAIVTQVVLDDHVGGLTNACVHAEPNQRIHAY